MCGTTFHKRSTLKIEGRENNLKMRVSDNKRHLASFLTWTPGGGAESADSRLLHHLARGWHLWGLRFGLMNVQGES